MCEAVLNSVAHMHSKGAHGEKFGVNCNLRRQKKPLSICYRHHMYQVLVSKEVNPLQRISTSNSSGWK